MDYLAERINLPKKIIDFIQKTENRLGKGASGEVYLYETPENKKSVVKLLWDGEWEYEDEFYDDIIWQSSVYEQVNKLERSVKVQGYNHHTDTEGYNYICFGEF